MSNALFKAIGTAGNEYAKRVAKEEETAERLEAKLFPAQRRVIEDPHPFKAVLCPRRSGKSYVAGVGGGLCLALRNPGARVLIVGLTVQSVKRSFWRLLERIVREEGIGATLNLTEMSITFDNGSYLFLFGAETIDRIERLRGDEYDLVIVDEAKSFSPHALKYLLEDVVGPAVATREGQIWMVGTPGHVFDGEFYWATNPDKADPDGLVHSAEYEEGIGERVDVMWSFHHWTMADNTGVKLNEDGIPLQWLRALADKKRRKWRDDHPTWRREFLGIWVVDEDGLVYALAALAQKDKDRVTWIPDRNKPGSYGLPDGDWHFLLGIDFGWENPSAFVVAAYCQKPQMLRILHAEGHKHLVLSQIGEEYRRLSKIYGGFETVVVDAGAQGKMIHETLRSDHQIPAIAAEKRDKYAYQQAFNSDLHSGRIQLIENDPLWTEMTTLAWDLSSGSKSELARKGSLKEDPTQPNDLCDAALYLWRYSAHRWEGDDKLEEIEPGTMAWWINRESEAKAKALEAKVKAREALDVDLQDEPFTAREIFGDNQWGANGFQYLV